jgi:effector-binding domain-containing protein
MYNEGVKKLKPKKVKGRVRVLKAMPYRDCPVYIRQIDTELFMYDLIYNNQIYSSYLIIKPKKGTLKLTESEIGQAGALIMTGAMATIDTLLGTKLDKKTEDIVKTVEANRSKFDKKGVN